MKPSDFRQGSYWLTTRKYVPGQPLAGGLDVDVAIVGGGFTGLSSAYHLVLGRKPDLTDVLFVNCRTIPWAPGPLRSVTIQAILGYMHWEDRRFDGGWFRTGSA